MSEELARDLTHAVMRHYGYTDEQIEVAEDHLAHEVFGCQFDGNHMRWDCEDEAGNSRHPDHDELARTANLMVDVVVPIVEREIRRGQRDLAAKVEALCDRADGSASDDPDVRDEIGEAWIKARELRALLADALPQDAAEEPASVPLAAEDDSRAAVDVPGAAGLSEAQGGAEMRDGGAGL